MGGPKSQTSTGRAGAQGRSVSWRQGPPGHQMEAAKSIREEYRGPRAPQPLEVKEVTKRDQRRWRTGQARPEAGGDRDLEGPLNRMR